MIPASINSQTYFFSISHITKEPHNRLVYGIRLNTRSYFLSKISGMNQCVQLDTNPALDAGVLDVFCNIMSAIELKYKRRPTLEIMNREIFSRLIRSRTKKKAITSGV